jgi:putative glutamine transport system substrate-binding protein
MRPGAAAALAAVAALLAAPTRAHGADALPGIRARGKLIVSVKNQGAASPSLHKDPAHFQKRNYEIAIARALAKKIFGDDQKLELKLMPKRTRVPALVDAQVDLVVSMLAARDDDPLVDFSQPYCEGGLALLASARAPVARLRDLDGKKVAVVDQTVHDRGAELRQIAAHEKIRLQIVRYPTFATAVAGLDGGQVRALASMAANLDAFLAQTPSGFARVPGLLTHERYAVAVKKGHADLLALVNDALAELKASGELARLADAAQIDCRP